ncbi:MAG: ribonuclease HI family protein [Minisyncoccia bacterium]
MSDFEKIEVFVDGGSRGNPGEASLGVVIGNKEYGQYLGKKTNNEAEYEAVIFALKKLKSLFGKEKLKDKEVIINLDSELVFKQLTGQYKVLEPAMQKLFMVIWNLKFDFPHLKFNLIPREKNKRADQLVNKILDQQEKKTLF